MGQGLLDTMQGFQKVIMASTSLLWGVKPLPTSLPNHFTELYSKDLFSLRMCSFTWLQGLLPWWAGACQCSVPLLHCLQISSNTKLTPHAGRGTTSLFCFYFLQIISPTLGSTLHLYHPPSLHFPEITFFPLESLVTWCILSRNLYLRF